MVQLEVLLGAFGCQEHKVVPVLMDVVELAAAVAAAADVKHVHFVTMDQEMEVLAAEAAARAEPVEPVVEVEEVPTDSFFLPMVRAEW